MDSLIIIIEKVNSVLDMTIFYCGHREVILVVLAFLIIFSLSIAIDRR